MGGFKGRRELADYRAGKKLSRAKAMKAKCYECNGGDEGRHDCGVDTCPMYPYRLYPEKALSMDSAGQKRAL
jgi:hypothetical protein